MQRAEHPLDKYILATKASLTAIPDDDHQVIDTSFVQMMCLEKFANYQGYTVQNGLFVIDNPANRVMSLDGMVSLYNKVIAAISDHVKEHLFIERVYLAGRNLRKPVTVQKHQIKFL